MHKLIARAIFALLISVLSCSISPIALAKEIPTWAGVQKNSAQLAADQSMIEAVLKLTNGDAKQGAKRAVEAGWREIQKNNVEQAIKRFNQAWLIEPKLGDIYWGFAVATGIRGDELSTVEKWFTKAESIVGPHWLLHSDWGRILDQRNEPRAAIPHFVQSIKANPKNPKPHIGMIRAASKLGDKRTAEKHIKIYESLVK